MNSKKTILYLLSGIFVLIFVYNYVLPYMVTQNYTGMGMHMSSVSYNNSSYYYFGSLIIFLIFILIVLVLVMAIFKLFSNSKQKQCKKCGLIIESDSWLICPRCGNNLHDGSVNK